MGVGPSVRGAPADDRGGVLRFAEKRLDVLVQQWVNSLRGDLGQRYQNEISQMKPRVRYGEERGIGMGTAEEQQVEIDRARLF